MQVVLNRETGMSRGFGFLTFVKDAQNQHAAEKAIKALNGQDIEGTSGRKQSAPPLPLDLIVSAYGMQHDC